MQGLLESPAKIEAAMPLLLRIPEVARMLSLSRSRVYEMTQTGEMPHVRMGKSVRVPHSALLRYIELRTVGTLNNDAA